MWGDIAIAFLLAFITSFVATPYTIRLAKKIGAVDVPKEERKIHKKVIPRLGGLAVIAGSKRFRKLLYKANRLFCRFSSFRNSMLYR